MVPWYDPVKLTDIECLGIHLQPGTSERSQRRMPTKPFLSWMLHQHVQLGMMGCLIL